MPADAAELLLRVEMNDEPVVAFARSQGLSANMVGVRLHGARHALKSRLEALMRQVCGVHV